VRSFQPTVEGALGGDWRSLCDHGSPRSYNHVIGATILEAELAAMFDGHKATVSVVIDTSKCCDATIATSFSTLPHTSLGFPSLLDIEVL
jgi:hypothetical protein